jgi:farnesyl diphosphate synthase
LAQELRRDAYQSLEGFGEMADRLRQVTDFIIQREF